MCVLFEMYVSMFAFPFTHTANVFAILIQSYLAKSFVKVRFYHE